MSISYSKFFAPTVLPITTPVTLLTVPTTPPSTLLRGGRIRLTNTTAVAATVTMYAVPAGGVAGPGNAFVSSKAIAANDYIDVDAPLMSVGDFLQGMAGTAASITAHMISGSYFA